MRGPTSCPKAVNVGEVVGARKRTARCRKGQLHGSQVLRKPNQAKGTVQNIQREDSISLFLSTSKIGQFFRIVHANGEDRVAVKVAGFRRVASRAWRFRVTFASISFSGRTSDSDVFDQR